MSRRNRGLRRSSLVAGTNLEESCLGGVETNNGFAAELPQPGLILKLSATERAEVGSDAYDVPACAVVVNNAGQDEEKRQERDQPQIKSQSGAQQRRGDCGTPEHHACDLGRVDTDLRAKA